MVEAMRHLGRLDSRYRLLLIGDGPRRARLERAVQDAGLGNRALFVGFQANLFPWYAAMDVFVLPSLTEGTPMALLEAMAHHVPVIATAVGGVPAVITHRQNGWLVKPREPHVLCEAMRLLGEDGALRSALAAAAGRTIRNGHAAGAWVERVYEVYHKAISQRVQH